MTDPNRNALAARVLMQELAAGGVRHVAVSPGSRSAPLALAARRTLEVSVHTDERCGGFFALGLARASGRPVALVCTSGTAGAHYLPAVIEARASRVPLVVLTADRPDVLLDAGAPQTMDQEGLLTPYVRFQQTIQVGAASERGVRWLRARVGRALEAARSGPVHLNLRFDEPLSDVRVPGDVPDGLGAVEQAFAPSIAGRAAMPVEAVAPLLRAERPVVVAGPQSPASARVLAEALGAPLLADPLSGLREGAVTGFDALVRFPDLAEALAPDLVVHVGRTPTCKHLGIAHERHGVRRVVFDASDEREDPHHLGTTYVRSEDLPALVPHVASAPREWLARWRAAESAVAVARSAALEKAPLGFEGTLFRGLFAAMPKEGRLLVASSMPVRQLDAFWAGGPQEVVANRGVNGIDGLVSTTFGIAADGRPTWAVLGDLALLHDLGGFAAAPRLGLAPVVVVINNGGGGIFSYLPLAKTAEAGEFSQLFTTPHQTTFAPLADLFGLDYARPGTEAELAAALMQGARAKLVELTVDREDSVARHRAFWADAADRARAALGLTGAGA